MGCQIVLPDIYSYRKRMLCLHCSVNSMLTSMFTVGSEMDRKKNIIKQ